jgi:hypothetical protein
MLLITCERELALALTSPISKRIRRLLRLRSEQLGANFSDEVHFAIVQPADTPADLQQLIGLPIFGVTKYGPDWVQEHDCAFEMVFDLTEEFTQVIIIPKQEGIDRQLLSYATAIATEHA